MKRLRPRTTALGGAAIGLIAGAAVYGAVSSGAVASSTPTSVKPSVVRVASDPAEGQAPPAACAAGQKLENGICVVHVEKVVVRPAPAFVQAEDSAGGQAQDTSADTPRGGGSSSANQASAASHEPADVGTDDATEATGAAEPAEAAEHAPDAARDATKHAAEAPGDGAEHATGSDG